MFLMLELPSNERLASRVELKTSGINFKNVGCCFEIHEKQILNWFSTSNARYNLSYKSDVSL